MTSDAISPPNEGAARDRAVPPKASDTILPFLRYLFGAFSLFACAGVAAVTLLCACFAFVATTMKPTVLGELMFLRYAIVAAIALRITFALGDRVLSDQKSSRQA